VPLVPTAGTTNNTPASSSLLDRARLATWYLPAQADPPIYSDGYLGSNLIGGYQESDTVYSNDKYYLFSTGSQMPAWIIVYVGTAPEELVKGPPAFSHVAPVRYPTVVKDGNTWHLWGVNPSHSRTEHWISNDPDPINFTYSDSPFPSSPGLSMVDFAVRKDPANGFWYGVGFEPRDNSPLLLARALGPEGPWEKLNYKPNSFNSGIFSDTGAPPWASGTRPDPDLAFTPDGRAWVFFSGEPAKPDPPGILSKAGVVEVDLDTGKAIGNAVVLFDPDLYEEPFEGAADLNLISVPGQLDRIFAETGNPDYPLVLLDLPDLVTPTDGRTPADLVRLDMAKGIDVATGMSPTLLLAPYLWDQDGLVLSGKGGAASYLASAYLGDLTFQVDFTPASINPSAINVVAHIGGPDYDARPGITVQIDATGDNPYITADITGSTGPTVTLKSGVIATPNTRYSVILRRVGSDTTLSVNEAVTAHATQGAAIGGLREWSLGTEDSIDQPPRYPFQGTIHSFVVIDSGAADQ
jgi:hypothetical protein